MILTGSAAAAGSEDEHSLSLPPRVAGLFSQMIPPIGRRCPPPSRTRGLMDPPTSEGPLMGSHRGLVVGVFECGPTGRPFEAL